MHHLYFSVTLFQKSLHSICIIPATSHICLNLLFKGSEGLEEHVNTLFDVAKATVDEIKSRPENFKLVLTTPEFVNVCFWYIPKRLQGQENSLDYNENLHKVRLRSLFVFSIINSGLYNQYQRAEKRTTVFLFNIV